MHSKKLHGSLEPTDYLIRMLQDSEKDIAQGYVSPEFKNAKEAEVWLNDPKAKYKNGHSESNNIQNSWRTANYINVR